MRNFQDTFETRKRSFISTFSICMTVTLKLGKFFPWEKKLSHKLIYLITFQMNANKIKTIRQFIQSYR